MLSPALAHLVVEVAVLHAALGVAVAVLAFGIDKVDQASIGAMPAIKAPAGLAPYAASTPGVLRLVESDADEAKRHRLRVNAIMPGTIDTPRNRAAMPDPDTTAWVTPVQLGEAIAFLLSDAASGITGALVPVTGRG